MFTVHSVIVYSVVWNLKNYFEKNNKVPPKFQEIHIPPATFLLIRINKDSFEKFCFCNQKVI